MNISLPLGTVNQDAGVRPLFSLPVMVQGMGEKTHIRQIQSPDQRMLGQGAE